MPHTRSRTARRCRASGSTTSSESPAAARSDSRPVVVLLGDQHPLARRDELGLAQPRPPRQRRWSRRRSRRLGRCRRAESAPRRGRAARAHATDCPRARSPRAASASRRIWSTPSRQSAARTTEILAASNGSSAAPCSATASQRSASARRPRERVHASTENSDARIALQRVVVVEELEPGFDLLAMPAAVHRQRDLRQETRRPGLVAGRPAHDRAPTRGLPPPRTSPPRAARARRRARARSRSACGAADRGRAGGSGTRFRARRARSGTGSRP